MKNLVEVASIYIYETPEYYTVQSGIDSNLNRDSAPDRVINGWRGWNGKRRLWSGCQREQGFQRGLRHTRHKLPYRSVAGDESKGPVHPRRIWSLREFRAEQPMLPIHNFDLTLLKQFNQGA